MHAWIFHHSESLGEWKYKPKYNEDQDSHANIFILLRVTRSQPMLLFQFSIFLFKFYLMNVKKISSPTCLCRMSQWESPNLFLQQWMPSNSQRRWNRILSYQKLFICQIDFNHRSEVSKMFCNHVYHQEFIVQWLKNSHMCRYPMPNSTSKWLDIVIGSTFKLFLEI